MLCARLTPAEHNRHPQVIGILTALLTCGGCMSNIRLCFVPLFPYRCSRRVKIDYRPVHMKPLDEEMEFVPPKPRVY
jgi:hypothetical protein